MRPFEIILLLLLLILLFTVISKRKSRVNKLLSGVLLLTLCLHYFIEGFRWQLYIVYLISFVFGISVFINLRVNKKWLRNTLMILALLLISLSSTLGLLIPIFKLPKTAVDYELGTQFISLEDATRGDRKLNVKFWYPSDSKRKKRDVYCENPSESLQGTMGMPGFIFNHLRLIKVDAYSDNIPSQKKDKFPLVVYSHGASSTHIDNTALLQEIAGQGYIVMAIDYDFSFEAYGLSIEDAMTLTLDAQRDLISALIKKAVPNQVRDIQFVLHHIQNSDFALSKHIDFDKLAFIGHSLGGTTSFDASTNTPGLKGVVNIDGPVNETSMNQLSSPLLYISSYSPDLTNKELESKGLPEPNLYREVKNYELENVNKLFDKDLKNAFWVRFTTAGHLDFTDFPFIIPMMTTKGYDKLKGHELKTQIIINFLNTYLQDKGEFKKSKDTSVEWLK